MLHREAGTGLGILLAFFGVQSSLLSKTKAIKVKVKKAKPKHIST